MQKNLQRISASACALVLALAAHTANAADTAVSSPTTPPRPAKAHKPVAPTLTHRLQAICSAADLNHDGNVSLDEFHQDIVQGWHSLGPDAEGLLRSGRCGPERYALAAGMHGLRAPAQALAAVEGCADDFNSPANPSRSNSWGVKREDKC